MRKATTAILACLFPFILSCSKSANRPLATIPSSAGLTSPNQLVPGKWGRVSSDKPGIDWGSFHPDLKDPRALKLDIRKEGIVVVEPYPGGGDRVFRYSLDSDGNFELTLMVVTSGAKRELKPDPKSEPKRIKATATVDQLVLSDEKGNSDTFKRESLPPGTPLPNNPEELTRDYLAAMKELTAALQGIQDEASYKAAMPGMEKTAKVMQELNTKMEAVPMSLADRKKLRDKFPDAPQIAKDAEQARSQVMEKLPGKAEELTDMLASAGFPRKTRAPVPKDIKPDVQAIPKD